MRRIFLAILIAAMILCFYWIYNPKHVERYIRLGGQAIYNFWFEKELLIAGDSNLSDKTIKDLLPTEQSIFWWLMNMDIIEGDLKRNPWIIKADVHPCTSSIIGLWGCFVVNIEERKPSFLVTEGDVTWLVGEDGGFFSPLTPRLRELYKDRKLCLLKGFYDDSPSAELFNARFRYVYEAVKIIEKRMHRRISSVELLPSGELEVSFDDNAYSVVFSGGLDGAELLHFELDRLDVLLGQFEGKEDTIKKIDLAFNKLAVVTFKENVPNPQIGNLEPIKEGQ